ncbi:MAG: hypothetical protein AAFN77_06495 [Planctomycetota bacterium]
MPKNIVIRFIPKIATAVLLTSIVVFTGCQQQRYEPSKWRPALETETLPIRPIMAESGSMPLRGSLPTRTGSLPNRATQIAASSKLVWDTTPKEAFYSPRSQQQRTTPMVFAGTLPTRGSAGSTLPARLPDHLLPRTMGGRNNSLPSRGGIIRNTSTLPARNLYRSNGTLPRR